MWHLIFRYEKEVENRLRTDTGSAQIFLKKERLVHRMKKVESVMLFKAQAVFDIRLGWLTYFINLGAS